MSHKMRRAAIDLESRLQARTTRTVSCVWDGFFLNVRVGRRSALYIWNYGSWMKVG